MRFEVPVVHAALASLAANDAFSGAVHISRGAEMIYSEGFGYAQRAERILNRPDTRFGIASGGKTFTAVAVLRLIQEGRLRLDSPLSEIVPFEFPLFDRGITVHHLLCHTAGNPDYFDEDVMTDYETLWAERPMYRVLVPADFIAMFRDLPTKFLPGTRFSYNNAGYILLGLIIEAVTSEPFAQVVEKTVFARARMNASGYFRLDQLPDNTAFGYIEAGDGGWRTNQYSVPVIGGPDGGVFTTGPDMQRFWSALLDGRLVEPNRVTAMLSPQVRVSETGDGASSHYGYGVWVQRREGEAPRSFALGADPGVSYISALWPEESVAITVLSNTDGGVGKAWRALREAIGW